MATSITFSPPTTSFSSSTFRPKPQSDQHLLLLLRFQTPRYPHLRFSSRRTSNYSQNGSLMADSRNWRNGSIGDLVDEDGDDDDEDDDEDEDEDRSLDLLVRFVQNVFRKISKRARKAVRSVLPVSISTKLVGFSVNGLIILAFLWVLKALLEVVCTFGSLVFVSILLIRGIWSGIAYVQEIHNRNANVFEDEPGAWSGTQPAG